MSLKDAKLNEKGARIIASIWLASISGVAQLRIIADDDPQLDCVSMAARRVAACHGAWWAAWRMLTNLLRPWRRPCGESLAFRRTPIELRTVGKPARWL
jgi:hypothetical protein